MESSKIISSHLRVTYELANATHPLWYGMKTTNRQIPISMSQVPFQEVRMPLRLTVKHKRVVVYLHHNGVSRAKDWGRAALHNIRVVSNYKTDDGDQQSFQESRLTHKKRVRQTPRSTVGKGLSNCRETSFVLCRKLQQSLA